MAAFFVVFLVVKSWATPASWIDDVDNWYRLDSLEEMKLKPLVFGGNESCKECHGKTYGQFTGNTGNEHKGLSCESCHGPVTRHAKGGKKIADAIRESKSTWQCQNCHLEMINKPKDFPQFKRQAKIKEHAEFLAGLFPEGTVCLKCHAAHDPTPDKCVKKEDPECSSVAKAKK
ncbi:MAG: multiheme c-type cytochrome [Rhodospirillales bacterium]